MTITLTVSGHEKLFNASEIEAMASEMERCLNLVARKSETYGNAWKEQGWMGNLARMQSKVARLKAMLWRADYGKIEFEIVDESVVDTTRDLINIAVFFLRNQAIDNKWGRCEV